MLPRRLSAAVDRRDFVVGQFRNWLGREPKLVRPRTLNEKIQWLKLYHRDPLMTQVTDKFALRDYVEETIGPGHTVPLLGHWSDPAEIDFDALPEQFALKVAGGYDMNIFCTDRASFDAEAARRQLAEWLDPERNHYYYSFEWAYKDVPPRVIAEALIGEPGAVRDDKIFCFNGRPDTFMVTTELSKSEILIDFFSLDWEPQPYTTNNRPQHASPPAAPRELTKMIDFAARLSRPFPLARVDFFETDDALYVGEITLYSGNGMMAETGSTLQRDFGDKIRLPIGSVPRGLTVEAAARLRKLKRRT